MEDQIIGYETVFRLSAFAGVFAVMAMGSRLRRAVVTPDMHRSTMPLFRARPTVTSGSICRGGFRCSAPVAPDPVTVARV